MKKKSVLTIFIMIALLAASLSFMFVPTTSNVGQDAKPALTLPTLTTQSVLRVDSNADFTLLNGFTGTGTLSDPYILLAKNIDATGSYNGIYIGNTTAHFIIRSCRLSNATTDFVDPVAYLPYRAGSGITFNNVTNGTIENSKIDLNNRGAVLINSNITVANDSLSDNMVDGIEIIASIGFIINNNTISNSTYGVVVRSSASMLSQGQISLNRIKNSGKDGVSLTYLHGGNISSNEIDSSHFNGTTLINSENNTLENNTFYLSGANGIALTNVSNTNIIHHNFFTINSGQGATISGSRLNQIYDNQFINNTDVGIRVLSGGANWVYRNYFSGNNNSFLTTNPQAYSAVLTYWNMTNGGIGNAWHNWISPDANYDGIVDVPYVIPGISQNDPRPLTGMVAPPSGLTATKGWLYVELSWNVPSYTLYSGINNYLIYRNDSVTPIGYVDGSTLSYIDGSPSANKNYNYSVTALNMNEGRPSGPLTVTTNATTAFAARITDPAVNDTIVKSTSLTVSWTMTIGGGNLSGYDTRLDNLAWNVGSASPETLLSLQDGPHKFMVMAHGVGTERSIAQVTFIVDTTGPNTIIWNPANATSYNVNHVEAFWYSNDFGSGVNYSKYQLDGGDWTFGGNGSVGAKTFFLTDGPHIILVNATDFAGNTGPNARLDVMIDTTAPTVTLTAPTNNTYWARDNMTVNWTGSDTGSGISYYEVKVDYNAWINNGNLTNYTTGLLNDARHFVSVRAVDNMSNVGPVVWVNFVIDRTGPVTTIVQPTNGSATNLTTVSVVWIGYDGATGIGVWYYQSSLDGAAWFNETTNTSHVYSGLSEGSHIVLIRAIDQLNNTGANASVTFKVDLTPPTVVITAPTTPYVNGTTTVTWTGSDGVGSGIAYYQYQIDDGSWTSVGLNLKHTFTGLTAGPHIVLVRANDSAGNMGTADSVSFIVDLIPPVVSISVPTNGTISNQTSLEVIWSGTDAGGSDIAYYEYRLDNGAWTGAGTDLSHIFPGLTDGIHTVYVRANDSAGNMGNVTSVWFLIDTTAPTVVITAPTAPYTNLTVMNVTWTGSDAGSGIAYYEIRIDGGAWTNVGLDLFNVFTGLTEGSHVVNVRANDSAGNMCAPVMVSFLVDLGSPVITITSPSTFYLNTTNVNVTWTVVPSGSGVEHYEVMIDSGAWTNVGLSAFHMFVGVTEGQHNVSVRGQSNAGNMGTTTNVTFIADVSNPVVSIIMPTGPYVNTTSVTITWNGSDLISGVKQYSYRVDNGTWTNVSLLTQVVIGSLAEGQHLVEVRVTDNSGNNATASRQFVLDTISPTLLILSPSEGSFIGSSTVLVTWNATDQTSGVARMEVFLANSWLTVVGDQISLDNLSEGVHTFKIRAVDNAGNIKNMMVNFTIDTIPPAVNIGTPTGVGVNIDTWVIVTFSKVMNKSSVSIALSGLDGTIIWDGETAIFRPSLLLDWFHTYTVTVEGKDTTGNALVNTTWTFQTKSAIATVRGQALDQDSNPVVGANVYLNGTLVATTDARGNYEFFASAGQYELNIGKDGMKNLTRTITLDKAQVLELGALVMSPEPPQNYDWLIYVIGLVLVAGFLFFLWKRKR